MHFLISTQAFDKCNTVGLQIVYLRELLRALSSELYDALLSDLEASITSDRRSLKNLMPAKFHVLASPP